MSVCVGEGGREEDRENVHVQIYVTGRHTHRQTDTPTHARIHKHMDTYRSGSELLMPVSLSMQCLLHVCCPRRQQRLNLLVAFSESLPGLLMCLARRRLCNAHPLFCGRRLRLPLLLLCLDTHLRQSRVVSNITCQEHRTS